MLASVAHCRHFVLASIEACASFSRVAKLVFLACRQSSASCLAETGPRALHFYFWRSLCNYWRGVGVGVGGWGVIIMFV